MFAILETGSKQYKVEEGDVLEVELLDKISNDNSVSFDNVLLVKDNDLHIGQPFVTDARIQAKVLEEFKGPKVIIFKKKSKKGYKRTRGHRQKLHRVQIEKIEIGVSEAKPEPVETEAIEEPKQIQALKETQALKEKQSETQLKATTKKEKSPKTRAKKEEPPETKSETSEEKQPDIEKEKE